MSARKPKAAPIDRSALPPVVHVSGLVVSGSNRRRLAFGRDDPVQRCVPSRPKRKGGKRDEHNTTRRLLNPKQTKQLGQERTEFGGYAEGR